MSIDDYEGLRQIYFEEVETVVVDGIEHTFKTPNYRTETIEEREQRLLKVKEHETKKKLELEEVMITIKLDEHTRIPILDNNQEPYMCSDGELVTFDRPYYRFETDEEMRKRIAKLQIEGPDDRQKVWKQEIIEVMEEYNDSWDQIEEIKVKLNPPGWYNPNREYKYPDPNKIVEQFDIEWYDIQWEEGDPPDHWSFYIWTKDRIYFPEVYDHYIWVGSISRNPSNNNKFKQLGGGHN